MKGALHPHEKKLAKANYSNGHEVYNSPPYLVHRIRQSYNDADGGENSCGSSPSSCGSSPLSDKDPDVYPEQSEDSGLGLTDKRSNVLLANRTIRHSRNVSAECDDTSSTPDTSYACPCCNSQCSTLTRLNTHIESLHSGSPPIKVKVFQCKFCPVVLKSKSDVRSHMKTHKNTAKDRRFPEAKANTYIDNEVHIPEVTRPFTCPKCQRPFTTKANFVRHVKAHVGKSPLFCQVCNSVFFDLKDLKRHTKTKHRCGKTSKESMRHRSKQILSGSAYYCSLCNKRFRLKVLLCMHALTHTTEKRFHCWICDHKFMRPNRLLRHIKQVHGVRDSYYEKSRQCSTKGGNRFDTSQSNRDPVRALVCDDSNVGPLISQQSDAPDDQLKIDDDTESSGVVSKSIGPSGVSSRSMEVISDNGSQGFTCKICGNSLQSRDALIRHNRKHRPFICDLCDRTFKTSGDWKKHMSRRHNGPQVSNDIILNVPTSIESVECFNQPHSYNSNESTDLSYSPDATVLKTDRLFETNPTDDELYALHSSNPSVTGPNINTPQSNRGDNSPNGVRDEDLDNPFRCDICGNRFKVEFPLNFHKLTHDRPKRLSCRVCHAEFDASSKYISHMRTHFRGDAIQGEDTGGLVDSNVESSLEIYDEAEVSCGQESSNKVDGDDCVGDKDWDKTSDGDDDVDGGGDYLCVFCGKKFRKQVHLDNHELCTHGADATPLCYICRSSFYKKQHLAEHLRIQHSIGYEVPSPIYDRQEVDAKVMDSLSLSILD